ncbi:hypothetical protein N7493_000938 [Penicillium malachiteum]|uniref:Uncharacterized protein n=1 Tax=Penicillium malachiteum TaxID=1324776 RepID=A0AAD6HXV7_9EURO|nr:hypothetical protein N7493_000938 [Penicillium malachiteum]
MDFFISGLLPLNLDIQLGTDWYCDHSGGSQLGSELAQLVETLAEPVVQGALTFEVKVDAVIRVEGYQRRNDSG